MPAKRDVYMEVDTDKAIIMVSGNTYDVHNTLKELGAHWKPWCKQWHIPFVSEEQYKQAYKAVKKTLEQISKENILYKTEVIKYPIGERKPTPTLDE